MEELLKRLCQEEEGQDLTEYALLLVLISLVAIVAVGRLGSDVSNVFWNTARHVSPPAIPKAPPAVLIFPSMG